MKNAKHIFQLCFFCIYVDRDGNFAKDDLIQVFSDTDFSFTPLQPFVNGK